MSFDKMEATMAEMVERYRSENKDEIGELFTVLAALGMHLVPLSVINFYDLDPAKAAVQHAFLITSPTFAARYEALHEQLQGLVTCGLIFCAECFPMHIYYGFGVGVFNDFMWASKCFGSGTCAELDRVIAAVKDERKEFWLLKKVPTGMDHIKPKNDKIIMKERKEDVKAREDFCKRVEKKGFPQPIDRSFTVNSWWVPFATWDSEFLLFNEGHSFERNVRYQLDPGRLLYAFIVERELNLREGELLLVPSGPGDCLVRWLEGLSGMALKVIPDIEFNFKKLGLSSSTKDTMHSRKDAYVIRDPKATSGLQYAPTRFPVSTSLSSPPADLAYSRNSEKTPDSSTRPKNQRTQSGTRENAPLSDASYPVGAIEMPGDSQPLDDKVCVGTVAPPPSYSRTYKASTPQNPDKNHSASAYNGPLPEKIGSAIHTLGKKKSAALGELFRKPVATDKVS